MEWLRYFFPAARVGFVLVFALALPARGQSDVPVCALIAILQDPHPDDPVPSTRQQTGDGEDRTLYRLEIPVEAGDRLAIRGQIEITNDNALTVLAGVRILVNGTVAGIQSYETCTRSGPHHMPLWADARFTAPEAGTVMVEAQLAVRWLRSSGNLPNVLVQTDGYGHLLVEHYRTFASAESAATNGGRLLTSFAQDRSEKAADYGVGSAYRSTIAYQIPGFGPLRPDDWVRLFGQSTSSWKAGASRLDMHGQAIFRGVPFELAAPFPVSRKTPWSTENTPWATQTCPLWTDGVDVADLDATATYSLSMHGVNGNGAGIVPGGGHLIAMLFPRSGGSPQRALGHSGTTLGAAEKVHVTANSGWQKVLVASQSCKAGDVLRLTGAVQVRHPGKPVEGISCRLRLQVFDAADQVVAESSETAKYMHLDLVTIPLRNEMLASVPAAGAYSIRLSFQCGREGYDPTVTLEGGQSLLFTDLYRCLDELP